MSIVPVAIVAIPPKQKAAFICIKNKKIYNFWLIKCPVIICKWSDRDSFLDLTVLRIYGHIDIKKIVADATIMITKNMKKSSHISHCFLNIDLLYISILLNFCCEIIL